MLPTWEGWASHVAGLQSVHVWSETDCAHGDKCNDSQERTRTAE